MNKPSPESQGGLSGTHYDPVPPVKTEDERLGAASMEAYIRYEGNDVLHGSIYRVRTEVTECSVGSWKRCTILIHD